MTDAGQGSAGDAAGDPFGPLLLGFAAQIDQLAGLIAGSSVGGTGPAASSAGGTEHGVPVGELMSEVGTLVGELGDLLARLLSALIAVLEAVAAMLRSDQGTPGRAPTSFQTIPVRITTAPAHP
ncbi:hypothetical protein C6V83_12885 [Gordonia iterans]|uniref:Uncharacterized protein n=1 Tax=Gordonia iterans TaxID=1004901 RepID=A0A2S0KH46_9ACTN|nr:hypothetical protein [Gordonia iterans]AVM01015.1 hypothetical protein C6V83_12885 [Gordonia iterans]